MKIVDCVWEIKNLGERVCEISIDLEDSFDEGFITSSVKDFDYQVIKVPMNMPDFNIGLSNLGFTLIENQINISKKFEDFDFDDRLVKYMIKHIDEKVITTESELDDILNQITPDMFSTDRIYLDPHFGKEASMRRYTNWIRTEFVNNASIVTKNYFDGREVGFGMYRDNNGNRVGLLGGIYESGQAEGFGLMTGCISFLAGKKYNKPFKLINTTISSNNVPMVQIYNYLHFKIDSMRYVFVKHNNKI